jgi:hypothetical protein
MLERSGIRRMSAWRSPISQRELREALGGKLAQVALGSRPLVCYHSQPRQVHPVTGRAVESEAYSHSHFFWFGFLLVRIYIGECG